MGSGHLQVARELARRVVERGDQADVVDILTLLPWRSGSLLRSGYAGILRYAPWLYEAIYRGFFEPNPGRDRTGAPAARRQEGLRVDPLVAATAPALRRLVTDCAPDAVVSTFHLAGQVTGYLRARGELDVPSTVVVTEFVAHRRWLHPGNDGFICVHPAVAAEAAAGTGRPASAPGPTVGPEFRADAEAPMGRRPAGPAAPRAEVRAQLGLPADRPVALVSAGAWGAGEVAAAADQIAAADHLVLVLCGRNERLRRELSGRYDPQLVRPFGWRDDLARLLRTADVLVENGGGQTAMEAFAVGLPVITFRPLPGHGRAGARRMSELGLTRYVESAEQVRAAIGALADPANAERRRMVATGRALFTADAAALLDGQLLPPGPAAPTLR